MNKKQMTIAEFANSIKHDYQTTSAFVKVLTGIGAAREVGKRAQASGRGKPSTVYEFDQEIELALWEDEPAQNETEQTIEVEQKIVSELGVKSATVG